MGRYITPVATSTTTTSSGNTGSTDSTGGTTSPIVNYTYATMVAGEALLAGDIVAINANTNKLQWCYHQGMSNYDQRPLYNITPIPNNNISGMVYISRGAERTYAYYESRYIYGGNVVSTRLSNGNLAVFYKSRELSKTISLSIYDTSGVLVTPTISVSTLGIRGSNIAICALTGGNVACIFTNESVNVDGDYAGTTVYYSIYSNTGAVVVSNATIETGVTGIRTFCAAPLTGGSFVVCWYRFTSNIRQPFFARISSAGALQGSVTQVDTTATSTSSYKYGQNLAVAGLTGGGFVIAYGNSHSTTNGTTANFARYNSSGILQGSRTSFATGITSHRDVPVDVCGLSDGGFAVISGVYNYGSGNFTNKHQKYDSSGSAVGAGEFINNISTNITSHYVWGQCKVFSTNDGGYIAIQANNHTSPYGTVVSRVASDGTVTRLGVLNASSGSPVNGIYEPVTDRVYITTGNTRDINSGLTMYVGARTAANTSEFTAISVSAYDTRNVSLTYHTNPVNPALNNIIIAYSMPYDLAFSIYGTGLPKLTLAGVVTADTAANASCQVMVKGTVTTRLKAPLSYSVDTRSQTPRGQKMSAVGNTATLLGISG